MAPHSSERPVDLVEVTMGVGSPSTAGNCLIGPYRPFGIVRLGPDALHLNRTNNGYYPGLPIQRFSHTHAAGTGGPPRYGNVGITPFTGGPEERNIAPFLVAPIERAADALPTDEKARLGFYGVNLRPWNVACELTCTRRVGVHRYRFPSGDGSWIHLDPSEPLRSANIKPGAMHAFQAWDSSQGNTSGTLQIVSDREIMGRTEVRGGWGHDQSYQVHWFSRSDVPFREVLLTNDGGRLPARVGSEALGTGLHAFLDYGDAAEINLRVGISYVSVANAREAVDRETEGRTFEEILADCESEWNELLSSFRVRGGTLDERKSFYTLLQRLFCMPTDLGLDENPHWKAKTRGFTDFYCLWDSVRNANSFFTLFHPSVSRDMLNALLDIADHRGWIPDAHIAHQFAYMQSACAADIVFPEAALKGLEGVDYRKALGYLRKNAEVPSPQPLVMGRLSNDADELGFISTRMKKASVSRHIETTYHDDCIGRLAARLGEKDVAASYRKRADRIWNLWRDDTASFFPRNPDGSWKEGYEPWKEGPEGWNDSACYEGSTAVWSFNVFQDFAGHVARVGGPAKFIALLDRLFDEGLFQIKETRMHIPHLYTYAGRPDRAAERILANLATFTPTPEGLTDNEDMGCQSGYYLWQSLGLYPIYGQTHYMLSPPLFDEVEAACEGRSLRVTATRSGRGRYVTGARLGDRALDRAWVEHDELVAAGRIHFDLADAPNGWGEGRLPPNGR